MNYVPVVQQCLTEPDDGGEELNGGESLGRCDQRDQAGTAKWRAPPGDGGRRGTKDQAMTGGGNVMGKGGARTRH